MLFVLFLQVQRKNLDLHLQKAMQEHLNFACDKLNSTQVQLDETQAELKLTKDQVRETQDTTRNLVKKLDILQRHFRLKFSTEKEDGKTRYIWKIDKFSNILWQAKAGEKGTIESDPFYTSCYGYKLKVSVIPYFIRFTGFSFSWPSHLSVSIFLMEGEYDNMLPWPFRKKITVTLIDQHEDMKQRNNVVDYSSVSRPNLFMEKMLLERPGKANLCVGRIPFFISHEKLHDQTRRYVVNDTLFLQVDVGSDE